MKKFSRYGVCIIVVLFFLLMNTPIYAYENTGNWHDEYFYDNEKELEKETREAIREILKEFYSQTSIKAIVVTVQDEEDKTGREIIQKAMQKYKKEDTVVIVFSMNRKFITCSNEKVDILPYSRSILSISESEYDKFAKNSVVNILKQIAYDEGKYFSIQKEKVNFFELLADDGLMYIIMSGMTIVTVIAIIFVVIILVIFIIRLCIEQLIEYFSS